MNTLFPTAPPFPEGFEYFPDFISEAEELELCNQVAKIELNTFTFQGYEANRKVASFGYDWSFETQSLSKGRAIPDEFTFLINKVSKHLSVDPGDFAELLVTEYPAGSVINWHRDAPPFDVIAGISMLSDCIFKLRPYEKALQSRGSVVSTPVRRRSLYVMKGSSRKDWQHSISPVKKARYSITLRTLRAQPGRE